MGCLRLLEPSTAGLGGTNYFDFLVRWAFACRTFAACFPSAVRVFFGKCLSVCLRCAAATAFLIFRLAAVRCFAVAM